MISVENVETATNGEVKQSANVDEIKQWIEFVTATKGCGSGLHEVFAVVKGLHHDGLRHMYGVDRKHLMNAAIDLTERFPTKGVYLRLNRIHPNFENRIPLNNTHVQIPKGDSVKDEHIERTINVLIECDADRPDKNTMATKAELDVALGHFQKAMKKLRNEWNWPEPLTMNSGSGWSAIFKADIEDTETCADVMEFIYKKLNNEGIKCDTSVFNSGRLYRIAGTWNRKGDGKEAGREHRIARLLSVPQVPEYLTLEQLVESSGFTPASKPQVPAVNVAPPMGEHFGTTEAGWLAWMGQKLTEMGIGFHGPVRSGGWTMLYLDVCPVTGVCANSAGSSTDIVASWREGGPLAYKNSHDRGTGISWKQFRMAIDPKYKESQEYFNNETPVASVPVTSVAAVAANTTQIYTPDFERFSDMPDMPSPKWLIKNWCFTKETFTMYGASGSCKSFVALDMALSIAHNIKFAGQYHVRPGKVAYVYSEGIEGCIKRVKGWMVEHNQTKRSENFYLCKKRYNLCDDIDKDGKSAGDKLAEKLKKDVGEGLIMVVIDTLAKNFGGAENDSEDMNKFTDSIETLRQTLGCTICVIHHTGKDPEKHERGSSALRANMDSSIMVSKCGDSGLITVENQKVKDEAGGKDIIFKPKIIKLGEDWDEFTGYQEISTLVMEPVTKEDQRKMEDMEVNKKLATVLKALPENEGYMTPQNWLDTLKGKGHGMNHTTLKGHIAYFLQEQMVSESGKFRNPHDPMKYKIEEKGKKWILKYGQ